MSIHILLIEADNARNLGGACMRDIINMDKYIDTFVKNNNNIKRGKTVVLTIDNKAEIQSKFTKNNIIFDKLSNYKRIFTNFVTNLSKNDYVIISIAGHGYQMRSKDTYERDKLDEFISFNSGIIKDNELNLLLLRKLTHVKRVICVIDTCHSATMFDPDDPNNKYTNVYSLGACQDNQLASNDIGNIVGFGGALTIHLLEIDNSVHTLLLGTTTDIQNMTNKIGTIIKPLGQTPVLITPVIPLRNIKNTIPNKPNTTNIPVKNTSKPNNTKRGTIIKTKNIKVKKHVDRYFR